jgi:L-aspartate oxidase
MLVHEGPARVRDLLDWGVRFSQSAAGLSLGREGGHSRRRILHAADLTGREIERALLHAIAEHPRITLVEDLQAVDLRTSRDTRTDTRRCTGALLLEHRTGALVDFEAGLVLLATGGLGHAYRHTTNPDIATGDGVAMAYRAGVTVANLEFVQFHPTALYPAEEHAFLISEAVRGEGAVLRTQQGLPLMEGVHELASLAPRDIVARTIDVELKASGAEYVLLDLSPVPRAHIEERFPGILAECRERGIDILRDPVPVVPAAHYSCGGVLTDHSGHTTLAGLHAAGEVACTGVHGANRLASNSLLEAVVYSHRASLHVESELRAMGRFRGQRDEAADSPTGATAVDSADAGEDDRSAAAARSRLRDLMWADAGIARSDERLAQAAQELATLASQADALVARNVTSATVELRNLVEVAGLVVRCARERRESRGLHYNIDHPYTDNEGFLRDTIVQRDPGAAAAA